MSGGAGIRMNALIVPSTIVACPNCEAVCRLDGGCDAAGGSIVRCAGCGHGWIEASAVEVTDLPAARRIEDPETFDLDGEARRIAAASRALASKRAADRKARVRTLRGWGLLAAAMLAPVAVASAMPETVVRLAPATAVLYATAGFAFNMRGLEIRNAMSQLMTVEETRVLAVKGEIVNVTAEPLKVPSMRFVLRDGAAREVYAWTLASVSSRSLNPGEATSFVSRIAAPPEQSYDVEIRFARGHELAVNAGP